MPILRSTQPPLSQYVRCWNFVSQQAKLDKYTEIGFCIYSLKVITRDQLRFLFFSFQSPLKYMPFYLANICQTIASTIDYDFQILTKEQTLPFSPFKTLLLFSGFMSSPAFILEDTEINNYSPCFLISMSLSFKPHIQSLLSSITMQNLLSPRASSSDS